MVLGPWTKGRCYCGTRKLPTVRKDFPERGIHKKSALSKHHGPTTYLLEAFMVLEPSWVIHHQRQELGRQTNDQATIKGSECPGRKRRDVRETIGQGILAPLWIPFLMKIF